MQDLQERVIEMLQEMSLRQVGKVLGISHETVRRIKAGDVTAVMAMTAAANLDDVEDWRLLLPKQRTS